jgi:ATP-binding cassette subfamily B protein
MEINIGEKIGIIGSNGAGKTTFIKLIAGLYKPLGGDIFLNDRNYSELSKKFFIQNFAVLFQNYEIYATSIAENVLMKPIENLEIESLLVEDALKNVGLWEKIRKLEHGIFTPLLKEFNEAACAFSTGEYQRIALARIFTKKY